MGAPEIIALLQGPQFGHRAFHVAMAWPSLAAALSDLCDEHDVVAPLAFRSAAVAVRGEVLGTTPEAAVHVQYKNRKG